MSSLSGLPAATPTVWRTAGLRAVIVEIHMKKFEGQALSWGLTDGVVELALHREPCNEIGLLTLEELERFAVALEKATKEAHALIIHSSLKCGFSAGADLKELFRISQEMDRDEAVKGVRN